MGSRGEEAWPGDSPPRGDVTDGEMRYQQPHKPHTKRPEVVPGEAGGKWAPRAQPARGLPKAPQEEGAARKHRLAEVANAGRRADVPAAEQAAACHRSPGVFNLQALSTLAPPVPRPEIHPRLAKLSEPGL